MATKQELEQQLGRPLTTDEDEFLGITGTLTGYEPWDAAPPVTAAPPFAEREIGIVRDEEPPPIVDQGLLLDAVTTVVEDENQIRSQRGERPLTQDEENLIRLETQQGLLTVGRKAVPGVPHRLGSERAPRSLGEATARAFLPQATINPAKTASPIDRFGDMTQDERAQLLFSTPEGELDIDAFPKNMATLLAQEAISRQELPSEGGIGLESPMGYFFRVLGFTPTALPSAGAGRLAERVSPEVKELRKQIPGRRFDEPANIADFRPLLFDALNQIERGRSFLTEGIDFVDYREEKGDPLPPEGKKLVYALGLAGDLMPWEFVPLGAAGRVLRVGAEVKKGATATRALGAAAPDVLMASPLKNTLGAAAQGALGRDALETMVQGVARGTEDLVLNGGSVASRLPESTATRLDGILQAALNTDATAVEAALHRGVGTLATTPSAAKVGVGAAAGSTVSAETLRDVLGVTRNVLKSEDLARVYGRAVGMASGDAARARVGEDLVHLTDSIVVPRSGLQATAKKVRTRVEELIGMPVKKAAEQVKATGTVLVDAERVPGIIETLGTAERFRNSPRNGLLGKLEASGAEGARITPEEHSLLVDIVAKRNAGLTATRTLEAERLAGPSVAARTIRQMGQVPFVEGVRKGFKPESLIGLEKVSPEAATVIKKFRDTVTSEPRLIMRDLARLKKAKAAEGIPVPRGQLGELYPLVNAERAVVRFPSPPAELVRVGQGAEETAVYVRDVIKGIDEAGMSIPGDTVYRRFLEGGATPTQEASALAFYDRVGRNFADAEVRAGEQIARNFSAERILPEKATDEWYKGLYRIFRGQDGQITPASVEASVVYLREGNVEVGSINQGMIHWVQEQRFNQNLTDLIEGMRSQDFLPSSASPTTGIGTRLRGAGLAEEFTPTIVRTEPRATATPGAPPPVRRPPPVSEAARAPDPGALGTPAPTGRPPRVSEFSPLDEAAAVPEPGGLPTPPAIREVVRQPSSDALSELNNAIHDAIVGRYTWSDSPSLRGRTLASEATRARAEEYLAKWGIGHGSAPIDSRAVKTVFTAGGEQVVIPKVINDAITEAKTLAGIGAQNDAGILKFLVNWADGYNSSIMQGMLSGFTIPNIPFNTLQAFSGPLQMATDMGAIETFKALRGSGAEGMAVAKRLLFESSAPTGTSRVITTETGKIITLDDLVEMAWREGLNTSMVDPTLKRELAAQTERRARAQWDNLIQYAGRGTGRTATRTLLPGLPGVEEPAFRQMYVEVANSVDSFYRATTFVHEVKAGKSGAEAADIARKAIFDYNSANFGPIDKALGKVTLFWHFGRRVQDQFFRTLVTNPEHLSLLARGANAPRQFYESGNEENYTIKRPAVMIDSMKKDDSREIGRILMAPAIPYVEAVQLWEDLFTDPLWTLAARAHPVTKSLWGAASGTSPSFEVGETQEQAADFMRRVPPFMVPLIRSMNTFPLEFVDESKYGGPIPTRLWNSEAEPGYYRVNESHATSWATFRGATPWAGRNANEIQSWYEVANPRPFQTRTQAALEAVGIGVAGVPTAEESQRREVSGINRRLREADESRK